VEVEGLPTLSFSNYLVAHVYGMSTESSPPVLEKLDLASNIQNATIGVSDSFRINDLSNRCFCRSEENSSGDT